MATTPAGKRRKDKKPSVHELKQANMSWVFDTLTGCKPYLTLAGTVYVALPMGADGPAEHVAAESSAVECWLLDEFHQSHKARFLNHWDMVTAIQTFTGWAKRSADVPRRNTYIRLAPGGDGTVWLDLGVEGKAVHLMAGRWDVVGSDALPDTICFERPMGYLPLPVPKHESGGTLHDLRRFVHTRNEQQWHIIVGWLLAALLPWGDHAILVLNGPAGSGKSTTMRYLRALIDPSTAVESDLADKKDMVVQATSAWISTFDNVSRISGDLSNTLCQISTGLSVMERKFFTNREPVVYSAHTPVILNGISNFVRADDLISRMLHVQLSPLADAERNTRSEQDAAFAAAQGSILAALLDVAAGLARLPEVRARHRNLPRLGDVWDFVTACEPALGWEPGTWDRVSGQQRATAHGAALENILVLDALLCYLAEQPARSWDGGTGRLFTRLTTWAKDKGYWVTGPGTEWPASPVSFGVQLKRAAAGLDAIGVTVEFYQGGTKNARERSVRLVDRRAELPSAEWDDAA